ncbi:proteasome assembly chaperone 2-like [Panonychus citri]|uniref:proteasome assembly chaperone 2-like n=1 Tax=Panonychus citri TaxID=50023 RepID=UPI00230754F7|nr:proteasome assembly chaperone 2-like [Panonychus citri]XP_053214500.1 proteasome assembly chaperone 2-like [Panonychus citri]
MKAIQFYNQLNDRGCHWNDCTLLMPAVSVGNVGQLAIDLLVTTLIYERKARLVGRIFSTALKSVSGPNAYQFGDDCPIMTTCEVYESIEYKLVIIQLRAPPYKQRRKQFVEELTKWIKEEQFKLTVHLSSSFSQFLSPDAFNSSSSPNVQTKLPVRYLATQSLKENNPTTFFEQLKLIELKVNSDDSEDHDPSLTDLIGSGLTKSLFQHWQNENINGIFFVIFCSEGDNTPEAIEIMEAANKLIKVKETLIETGKPMNRWKTPISWMNLFGGSIPANLF